MYPGGRSGGRAGRRPSFASFFRWRLLIRAHHHHRHPGPFGFNEIAQHHGCRRLRQCLLQLVRNRRRGEDEDPLEHREDDRHQNDRDRGSCRSEERRPQSGNRQEDACHRWKRDKQPNQHRWDDCDGTRNHEARQDLGGSGDLDDRACTLGLPEAEACAHLLEAWARLNGGDHGSAERGAERGLAAFRRYGTLMQSAYLLSVAVEVFVGCGRMDEAAAFLRDAQALVDDGAARWWEPELHRWQGALVVIERGAEGYDQAEEIFSMSLHIASQQEASSLRLRTSIDLARLWIARGRREDARRLIDQATARIVGGADTRDVRRAGELRFARGTAG